MRRGISIDLWLEARTSLKMALHRIRGVLDPDPDPAGYLVNLVSDVCGSDSDLDLR